MVQNEPSCLNGPRSMAIATAARARRSWRRWRGQGASCSTSTSRAPSRSHDRAPDDSVASSSCRRPGRDEPPAACAGPGQREVIEGRLTRAYGEIAQYRLYDYVLVNVDYDHAYSDLAHIYHAERLRRDRQAFLGPFVEGLLDETVA
jgi:hypothetical protein